MTTTVQWRRSLRDCDLDSVTKAIMRALADRMSADGTGYVSQLLLAADSGYSERTVRRRLRLMIEDGWIVRTKRGHSLRNGNGLASAYKLIIPVWNRPLEPVTVTDSSLEPVTQVLEPVRRDRPREPLQEKKQLAELDAERFIDDGTRIRAELSRDQIAEAFRKFSESNTGQTRTESGWRNGWSGWLPHYETKTQKEPALLSYTERPRGSEDEYTW